MITVRQAVRSLKRKIKDNQDYIVIEEIVFGVYKAMMTFTRYHSLFDNGTINIYMEDETVHGHYTMPLEMFNDCTYEDIEKVCQCILTYCLTEKEERVS